MIIRFETVNTAPPRIVKMNTDEDRIFLLVFDRHPLLQRNKDVGRPSHHDLQIGFAQLAGKTFGDIQGRDFLGAAKFAVSAIVFAAMSSIDNHGAERFAGISCAGLNPPGSGGASSEEPGQNKK